MIDSVISAIRNAFVPVHREGYPFIGICAAAALILFLLSSPLAWLAVLIGCWVAYFFRDPPRVTPVAPGLVISGADGQFSSVGDAVPPPELGLGDKPLQRISVFMNVFNVHVNRCPEAARVDRIEHRDGAFLDVRRPEAARRNEAGLYPIPLRQALPNLPIPLRPTDKDVALRLQPLLDDCYRDGRYQRLNYRPDPVPRLGEADARWADSILKDKGLR